MTVVRMKLVLMILILSLHPSHYHPACQRKLFEAATLDFLTKKSVYAKPRPMMPCTMYRGRYIFEWA